MSHGDEDTRTVGRRTLTQQGPGDRDRPCFIVIRGLNVGEMYKLARNEMVVGRGQHADIEILDDGISRRHARVRFSEERVEIEDLGSRNGTFVNGQRIEGRAQALRDGDKIQLSSTTILKFTFADRLDESFQRRMYESALRDALTKAFNKKYFLDRLEREFRFAKRHKQPLALLMFDVDAFRRLNDERGAQAGDYVLATIAGQVHHVIRSEDVFARYGGDEFAVICRATDGPGAVLFADRVRAELTACSFSHDGDPLVVTVSTGIAAMEPEHPDAMSLLAATEEALAHARAAGRDRVQMAGRPAAGQRPAPPPPEDEPTTTVSPRPTEPQE
jgi:two-component system, cell cycle response regulator